MAAEYLIVPDGLHGYGIEITWPGSFRSVRGFATLTAVQAWIEAELLREQSSHPDPDPIPA